MVDNENRFKNLYWLPKSLLKKVIGVLMGVYNINLIILDIY